MKLTAAQQAMLRTLHERRHETFSDLTRIAGLDKRYDFIRADLRKVDFGISDLSGFNFAEADLRGADMTNALGKDRLVLVGARLEGAKGLPRPRVRRDADDLPEMVEIPPGRFMMGIPPAESKREGEMYYNDWARPRHQVTIAHPFWLGRYPVTRGEFAAFVVATDRPTPDKDWTYEPDDKGEWRGAEREGRNWRNPGFEQTDRDPVVCVSHADATDYIDWINTKRHLDTEPYWLPSEAEWEYAARAGTETARFWGDGRNHACRCANVADRSLMTTMNWPFDKERFFDGDDGYAFTAPVGSFLPNPFGLSDMLGNVWEWTADPWHDDYKGAPSDGSVWIAGVSATSRVVRGGSWYDLPKVVRAGYRFDIDAGHRNNVFGFRLARTSF